MNNPDDPNAIKNDVLHSQGHTQLSSEEVAKAIARHKREHGGKKPAETRKTGAKRN